MAAIANLVLQNHAAANVTYLVQAEQDGSGLWADTAQGTPGGFRTVRLALERPKDPTKGVYRVRIFAARPVVNGTTGLVDYTSRTNSEIIIPVQATLAERQELYAAFKNMAGHAVSASAIRDLEGVW
jgi:hypothetical protein